MGYINAIFATKQADRLFNKAYASRVRFFIDLSFSDNQKSKIADRNMIIVDKVILSDDIAHEHFVCDLSKCKGACCVEGDLGAPLDEDELPIMEQIYEQVKPYMTPEGIAEVERQGKYIKDFEGDFSTPTIGDRECAYAGYDEKGVMFCAIEKAYLDGKIAYQKPISCHLYPIRINQYQDYDALNYDRWDICADACTLGDKLKVPVYKFLRGPLIRKYGKEWYEKLEKEVELWNKEVRPMLESRKGR